MARENYMSDCEIEVLDWLADRFVNRPVDLMELMARAAKLRKSSDPVLARVAWLAESVMATSGRECAERYPDLL